MTKAIALLALFFAACTSEAAADTGGGEVVATYHGTCDQVAQYTVTTAGGASSETTWYGDVFKAGLDLDHPPRIAVMECGFENFAGGSSGGCPAGYTCTGTLPPGAQCRMAADAQIVSNGDLYVECGRKSVASSTTGWRALTTTVYVY